MHNVTGTTDPAPAVCPICGDRPSARDLHRDGRIAEENLRDAAGHVWIVKWLVGA